MKSFAIAFAILSVVYGQEMANHLEHNQQLEQMVDQNQNLRSAGPVSEQKSQQMGSVQTFVLSGQQHHPQQAQIIKVVEQQPQHEKVVVQLGNSHKNEHLIIQSGHQQQQHHHNQQGQIIKVVEVEEHKKPIEVQRECHLFGRKGHCITLPFYVDCMMNGGLLFMSFSECNRHENTGLGCCVKNVIPFLRPGN